MRRVVVALHILAFRTVLRNRRPENNYIDGVLTPRLLPESAYGFRDSSDTRRIQPTLLSSPKLVPPQQAKSMKSYSLS